MIKDSELLKRAVIWISEQRTENANLKIGQLLDEAGRRFNLSPIQIDSLLRIMKDQEDQ